MTCPADTPHELTDAETRRRIREELDSTLFVEAAAGTASGRSRQESCPPRSA